MGKWQVMAPSVLALALVVGGVAQQDQGTTAPAQERVASRPRAQAGTTRRPERTTSQRVTTGPAGSAASRRSGTRSALGARSQRTPGVTASGRRRSSASQLTTAGRSRLSRGRATTRTGRVGRTTSDLGIFTGRALGRGRSRRTSGFTGGQLGTRRGGFRGTFTGGESISVVDFEVGASSFSLSADGHSQATIMAYLADADGNPMPRETVRFAIVQGTGSLAEAELGRDVSADRLGALAGAALSAGPEEYVVQGLSLGDGRYVARYQAGTTSQPVVIEAVWTSTNEDFLPAAEVVIDLRSPDVLSVFVDDEVLSATGQEQATVIGYLQDVDGRPVDGAQVNFNIVEGTGQLIAARELGIAQGGGRYAAVYQAGTAPGIVVIEVTVVDADVLLSEIVEIELKEATDLEVFVFPETVQRLPTFQGPGSTEITLANTATVVVAVRDNEGDLVRGLGPRDLIAEVALGPGTMTDMREILSPTGEGTGVYYATYIASRAEDIATILVTNLSSPGNPQAAVEVLSLSSTGVTGGVASDMLLLAFTDDIYDASSSSPPSLLLAVVANSDGNPVDGLAPEVAVLEGVGATSQEMMELPNLAIGGSTGVYRAGYLAASVAEVTDTLIRARVESPNGPTIASDDVVTVDPVLEPIAIVFPPFLPGDATSLATVDVFNLNDIVPDNLRYNLEIAEGSGEVVFRPANSGENGDLVAGDKIATGVYRAGAGGTVTTLEITDTSAAGLPAALADVDVGAPTILTVFAFPGISGLGESVAIEIYANDEFGDPLAGHQIRVDVVEGSATVGNNGWAVDDGVGMGVVQDAYANDGVYVVEVIISPAATGPILLRITDTTDPLQPSNEVDIDVF
ncbi:MAG: hypothetical protein HY335_10210 [Deinococcus sp.]|nr:hypothetical protein [Deinococcus sp.]